MGVRQTRIGLQRPCGFSIYGTLELVSATGYDLVPVDADIQALNPPDRSVPDAVYSLAVNPGLSRSIDAIGGIYMIGEFKPLWTVKCS
ncbi:hypothetical protein N7491_004632 [Penicillium cf. griseofulvum]|nr:hypothetical protein N7491_004632 [Penicillium cf. griseofulvum]